MEYFLNKNNSNIVEAMIVEIQKNAEYLSKIDGLIADGDHGINMNKGFSLCYDKIDNKDFTLFQSLDILGNTLLMEIGGSMGPLYGMFFKAMAKEIKEKDKIVLNDLKNMIKAGIAAIQKVGKAERGDKTLLDTLYPALESLEESISKNQSMALALDKMLNSAEIGMNSTKEMIANVGRASRLGERSIGVFDAGASSCFFILKGMTSAIKKIIIKG